MQEIWDGDTSCYGCIDLKGVPLSVAKCQQVCLEYPNCDLVQLFDEGRPDVAGGGADGSMGWNPETLLTQCNLVQVVRENAQAEKRTHHNWHAMVVVRRGADRVGRTVAPTPSPANAETDAQAALHGSGGAAAYFAPAQLNFLVRRAPPGPPRFVRAAVLHNQSVTVAWDAPARGAATELGQPFVEKFDVQHWIGSTGSSQGPVPSAAANHTVCTAVQGNSVLWSITLPLPVPPAVTAVRVRAVTAAGAVPGPWSPVVFVRRPDRGSVAASLQSATKMPPEPWGCGGALGNFSCSGHGTCEGDGSL